MQEQIPELDKDVLTRFCAVCFKNLETFLQTEGSVVGYPQSLPHFKSPLFVTWTKGAHQDLRGCIGTFAHGDIAKNLPRYALISSLQDSRFSPVKKSELPSLNVAVSILMKFEKIEDPYDWQVGKHGLEVEFGHYSATFLPEVAAQQEWDKKTTLEELCMKAGYYEGFEKVKGEMKVERYQSVKHSISYTDYQTFLKENEDFFKK